MSAVAGMGGLLAESRSAWTALYPGLLLDARERAARAVECSNCGAPVDYACTSVTGLVASAPCDARVTDAEQAEAARKAAAAALAAALAAAVAESAGKDSATESAA